MINTDVPNYPIPVAAVLGLLVFLSIAIYAVRRRKKDTEDDDDKNFRPSLMDNSVSHKDLIYLAQNLRPESTSMEILYYLTTTPESLQLTHQMLKTVDADIEKRKTYLHNLTQQQQTTKKSHNANQTDAFGMDDGGWADDSDDEADDPAVVAAKKAQEEKETLARQVKEASGKLDPGAELRIEGVDEGVIGQLWVEKVLGGIGQWPPPLLEEEGVKGRKLEEVVVDGGKKKKGAMKGKEVEVLDHREARRNLCMAMGRINATTLNTHPDLADATQNKKIDLTYFRSTMEFRHRTGILLEAALRIAASTRSYRLFKTLVEFAASFKIGMASVTSQKNIKWFQTAMIKTYGSEEGIPKIEIGETTLVTEDENEVCAGDAVVMEVSVDRTHAELFTKHKMAEAAKTGVDPRMALAPGTYREGWWFLVRVKRNGGEEDDAEEKTEDSTSDPLSTVLAEQDEETKRLFAAEKDENRLMIAWPFMVQSVAQKMGKIKVRFQAPKTPGKYEFIVDLKSQEFLGCDQSFVVEKEILDPAKVERKPKVVKEVENDVEDEATEEDEVSKKTN